MSTPLVSFRVLSILSQTVTGVVSTWLHFLQCGPSGSHGEQDGVGNRGVPSCPGLGVLHQWQEGARSRLPGTSLHLSAGRKSPPGASGQVSLQPIPALVPAVRACSPFSLQILHAGTPLCHLLLPPSWKSSLPCLPVLPPAHCTPRKGSESPTGGAELAVTMSPVRGCRWLLFAKAPPNSKQPLSLLAVPIPLEKIPRAGR